MKVIKILSIVILFSLGCWLWNWAGVRNQVEMRDAVMIDTRSDVSSHKGNKSYNTVGIFRDKLTGKVFGDSINDSLYRQFERDGKPIECRCPYSIDKVEQSSIGFFALILAFYLWLGAGGLAVYTYFRWNKK